MIAGNRGEWSEIYAFFKILSEGRLHPGDANLNKIAGFFYPVISILRKEIGKDITFSISGQNIIITDSVNPAISIPNTHFITQAANLLSNIKSSRGATFPLPSTEAFLNNLKCYTLKAKSTTKADIIIQIHDSRTNLQPILGFSIKSQLGGAPTLLNASTATNFIYKLTPATLTYFDVNQINNINSSRKIRDRIQAIYSKGIGLTFAGAENRTFHNNLVLIDSLLPEILSNALINYYEGKAVSLKQVCAYLTSTNPLGFDQTLNHKFYEHKLKRFLSEVALGMMPNTTWTGLYDGTEGYIVVKESGDVVCYHIINRNLFEDYLLNNTRFETPSSTRHGFGQIYSVANDLMFKLNLQIRFT
jgi:hypothetical protein